MIQVYFNYPTSHVTIHREGDCQSIRSQGKVGQRITRINSSTISSELAKFEGNGYSFQATPSANDMWVEIDFGDPEFERAVASHIYKLLGKYKRFRESKLAVHC